MDGTRPLYFYGYVAYATSFNRIYEYRRPSLCHQVSGSRPAAVCHNWPTRITLDAGQSPKGSERLLGLVADGKDPQAEKLEARERAAGTLGRVAADYLKHAKKKPKATQLFGD